MRNRCAVFAGSLRAGKRAAVIISSIHSAKLNENDPYRYLADILDRLLECVRRGDEKMEQCGR
jgi:hypothetical protein